MKTTIQVTQDDIDSGKPGLAWTCPIARAVQRSFPGHGTGHVGVTEARIRVGHKHYPASPTISEFVHNFDKGDPVCPFEFVLDDAEAYDGAF